MRLALIVWFVVLTAGSPEHTTAPPSQGEPRAHREAVEEGKLLYGIYCRNCHGPEGRGAGPEAKSLQPRPRDLTRLSRDNDGEFPAARVLMMIDGRSRVPGQVRGRMPIWGLSLQEPGADSNQDGEVRDKIERLVEYLKSIQPQRD
jgi:mono/diheme cytochrome c family protein